MRDPVLAGILSLIIPGVGQLYNGRILAGILWLIFTPGFWIGTGRHARMDLPPHRGLHGVLLRERASRQSLDRIENPV